MEFMSVLQQMLGGVNLVWIQIVLLLLLSVVVVWKREAIVSVKSLRRGFLLLALSVMLPSILSSLMPLIASSLGFTTQTNNFRGANPLGVLASEGMQFILPVIQSAGPVLIGMAILNLSWAIVPKFIPPPDYLSAGSDAPSSDTPSSSVPPAGPPQ